MDYPIVCDFTVNTRILVSILQIENIETILGLKVLIAFLYERNRKLDQKRWNQYKNILFQECKICKNYGKT